MKKILFSILGFLLTTLANGQLNRPPSIRQIADGDTLTLFTRYSECGEWGGHHEYLRIYSEQGLVGDYTRDSVYCDRHTEIIRYTLPVKKHKRLTKSDIKEIDRYIKDVSKLSKKALPIMANANNGFYVVTRKQEIKYLDDSNTVWNGFDTLLKKVLK